MSLRLGQRGEERQAAAWGGEAGAGVRRVGERRPGPKVGGGAGTTEEANGGRSAYVIRSSGTCPSVSR
jgi:hypothetical protein